MAKLPTPSQLHRVDACLLSEALPHAYSSGSGAAERGTRIHAFLEDVRNIGHEAALAKVAPEDIEAFENIPVDDLPVNPKQFSAEVAFAYNPLRGTARILGTGLSRDDAAKRCDEGEMAGIADVVGQTEDGTVLVYDYKSGHGHVPKAETNWQIKTYARMATLALRGQEAKVGIIRVHEYGKPQWDVATLDALELELHEADIVALLAKRQSVLALKREGKFEELPAPVVGSHCKYCPAFAACPAQASLARSLLPSPDGKAPMEAAIEPLTEESAAQIWERLQLARQTLDRVTAVIQAYARQQPVHIGDMVLSERECVTETIVPERAETALKALYGDQLGMAVFGESVDKKLSLTKSALRSAVRRYVLPTLPKPEAKITWAMERAIQGLRESRALSVKITRKVDVHRDEASKALPASADEDGEVGAAA